MSSHLPEDHLRLIPIRVACVKSQAAKHEITIIFLDPSGFENIAADANAWRKFMNEQVGPSQSNYIELFIIDVIYCIYLFRVQKQKGQFWVNERLGEAQKATRASQDFCFLYKYRQALCIKGTFFQTILVQDYCQKNYFIL